MSKETFPCFLSAVFLTVGGVDTYSVTMWEKVVNSGFSGFAAAKTDGGCADGAQRGQVITKRGN